MTSDLRPGAEHRDKHSGQNAAGCQGRLDGESLTGRGVAGRLHHPALPITAMTQAAVAQRCKIPRHTGRRPFTSAGLVVCAEHMAELRDLLADVLDLYQELLSGDWLLPVSGPRYNDGGGGGGGKRPDPPAPVNLTALALTTRAARSTTTPDVTRERNGDRLESNGPSAPDVGAVVAGWCRRVTTERNSAQEVSGFADDIAFLRQNASWIAGQSWVVAFDLDLRDCRRWLALAVGADPMPAPFCDCPHCGTPLWDDLTRDIIKRRRFGQDVSEASGRTDRVACPSCGATWEGVHGKARLLRIVRDEQQRRAEARTA